MLFSLHLMVSVLIGEIRWRLLSKSPEYSPGNFGILHLCVCNFFAKFRFPLFSLFISSFLSLQVRSKGLETDVFEVVRVWVTLAGKLWYYPSFSIFLFSLSVFVLVTSKWKWHLTSHLQIYKCRWEWLTFWVYKFRWEWHLTPYLQMWIYSDM